MVTKIDDVTTTENEWRDLLAALPDGIDDLSKAIADTLRRDGYLHLKYPISMETYDLIVSRLGTVVLRSDVKIDRAKEQNQEKFRSRRGRGGIYGSGRFELHTDTTENLVSWYCVEQDDSGTPMILLEVNDLEDHFSPRELDLLSKVEVTQPVRKSEFEQESFKFVPMLFKQNGKYRIFFYAPWLMRDSYDSDTTQVLEKFNYYLKHKEETQLITVPFKKHDSIFIDNHRILHGRGELPPSSKQRHLIRLILHAA